MAQDGKASHAERLDREIARTRHDLSETWTAFRAKLPWSAHPSSHDPVAGTDGARPSLVQAGSKPGLAGTSRTRPGGRRLSMSALLAGAAGLALVLPRMARKRRGTP